MGVYKTGTTSKTRFPAGYIYGLWHDEFRKSPHLHAAIESCMHEIALKESDNIISDKRLKIKIKELTNKSFEELLQPDKVMAIYQEHAPYTIRFLDVFAASPNPYRKRQAQAKQKGQTAATVEDEDEALDEDWDDDPNIDDDDPAAFKCGDDPDLKGFSRNPAFAIMLAISMLTFVRNRATNLLPLLCGLFFKTEGTSSRVMKMLSNTGLSISARTIERLKEKVTEEAIRAAGDLAKSGRLFAVTFDNSNLYLRKFDQRLTNQHSMIHATNTAVIAINA